MTKKQLIICAADTVDVSFREFYIFNGRYISISDSIEQMIENTFLYENDIVGFKKNKNQEKPQIRFSNKTTTFALRELYNKYGGLSKIGALSFASAKHPGGGFLHGAKAQEESIARVSTLYRSLLTKPKFYKHNISLHTALYSDYIIYSDNVTIFKDDNLDYLDEPFDVAIITSPAPNASAIRKNETEKEKLINNFLLKRIRKIIRVAIDNDVECLVLGAFGTGVFGNKIEDVSCCFKKVLIDEGYQFYFKDIEFAIYDREPDKLQLFEKTFKG